MNRYKIAITKESEIFDLIKSNSANKNNSVNIFCAGHFLLMQDATKQKLTPAIIDDTFKDNYYNYIKQTIGIFPQYTWQLAASIVEECKCTQSKNLISLLINDWQLVPNDEKREDMSKPNSFRENFYNSFNELPNVFNNILRTHNLTFEDDIYKTATNSFYLKEVSLRDRFMRKTKSILNRNENIEVPVGMCSLSLDECGNIKMQNEDNETHQLSANSKAGCAAGITQMILDLYSQFSSEYKEINFLNFMPFGCTNPVNIASELAINMIDELESKSKVNILNFYFDGSGTKKAEDFYNKENNKGVTGYMFNQ
jgi:hypothetical protein